MAQFNRTNSVNETLDTNENTNLWTTIRSKKANRSADKITDVSTSVETTNRFSRGLNKLAEVQQNKFVKSSDGSHLNRDMSVLHKLNSEHDEIRQKRAEHRELMERYMYRRPVVENKEQTVFQTEYIDVSDKSMFPSLIQSDNKETTIDTTTSVADGSLSQLMKEFKNVNDDKPTSIAKGVWGKGNAVSIIGTNVDKPVKTFKSTKKNVQKNTASESITMLLDISTLFADLLENNKLNIIDSNDVPDEDEIQDGYTKVSKNSRKKKILY
jgi:hypothetical protein